MTDRPIIFSGPMVRAILDGRKTQTRRFVRPDAAIDGCPMYPHYINGLRAGGTSHPSFDDLTNENGGFPLFGSVSPHLPGDRLWVRETWSHTGQGVWSVDAARMVGRGGVIYRADEDKLGVGWFPSIFMPREFSRLTLTITDVRVQRLQEISDEDARAEGCRSSGPLPGHEDDSNAPPHRDACENFADLWDSLNAKRAPWESNPWCCAISFSAEKANIDATSRAAA